MRLLLVAAALALTLAAGRPADASCAPPGTVADNAARAQLVVHGTVTSSTNGAVTLRVDRVLKGSSGSDLKVFVGPGRGGSGPVVAATSVDYAAATGTDHVLYVIKGQDGQPETNACIGSHPGQPTADETAFFGAGSSPDPGSGGIAIGPRADTEPWSDPRVGVVILIAAIAIALTVVRLSRRSSRPI